MKQEELRLLKPVWREPFDEYKKRKEFVSPSDIKGCKTPKQYKYKRDNPEFTETRDTLLGNYFHTLILEPDKIHEEYAIWDEKMKPFPDKNYQNKQNKDARDRFMAEAAAAGKKCLAQEIVDTANAMYESVKESESYMKIFDAKNGICEYSFLAVAKFYFGFEETGDPEKFFKVEILNIREAANIPENRRMLLKCRPDYISKITTYIADVKSSISASPIKNGFESQSFKMEYHLQAPMYIDIVAAATDRDPDDYDFYFGAVEKEPPYDNMVFACMAGGDFLTYGRMQYKTRLAQIKMAENKGKYKSYDIYSSLDGGICLLNIPAYAKYDEIKW